jgi:hypothetical protein
LAVELDPVSRVRRKFDFAGLGAKPRDNVSNGATSLELLDHKLCLAKTLSVPEINSLRNFLNRKICYDYGPCSTFRGYV